MPRFVEENSLNQTSFIEQWTRLSGVSSLLSCAGRTGVRIGIWGGCVRNFILDDRPLAPNDQSIHFTDFIDPFSDVDCVVDRAQDWPLVAQAISGSVAFAGYHRWEYQTISQVTSSLRNYARIAADSFIVWHEGFDAKRQPIITIQVLEENFAVLLREPLSRVGERNTVSDHVAWQEIFDSLRLSRYALQYPSGLDPEVRWVLPDRERAASIVETGESNAALSRSLLRLDLAVLDILMTAASLPNAMNFVRGFAARLPAAISNRASTITQIVELYRPNLTFLGALVFRQRNDARLRLKLMTRSEDGLSNGGFNSLIPWTFLWSLGTGDDDCCRHEDFKNGVAVLSWRTDITNDRYSHAQAFEFAPAAQIARYAPYGDEAEDEVLEARRLYSVPGIVRVGVSLTLRFDHAYMAQLLGRSVAMSVGLVSSEATQ